MAICTTFNARGADLAAIAQELQQRLAIDADLVTDSSRAKTEAVFGRALSPRAVVQRVCEAVAERGLAAALEFTKHFDGADISPASVAVSEQELAAAHAAASSEWLELVRRVRGRIGEFQQRILHRGTQLPLANGGFLRQRYRPVTRAGICVPGGRAAYPSSLLMCAVPAQVAGVQELAVIAPPTPFGAYNEHLLATCHELGIREVYRLGGAQGVAALAHGWEACQPVDLVVGPGNLFVALAKQHLFGKIGIDAIAGPSEVVVLADDTTPPEWIAADLIAQAEHAPGSSVLVTWDEGLLPEVQQALAAQLSAASRGQEASQALEEFGALVLVEDRHAAAELTNQLAPEHLHIECADAEGLSEEIDHAGVIFLGPQTPVAVGDYLAGPSHCLPTGATARFASGLSANTFLRSAAVVHFAREDLQEVANDVVTFAQAEGLTGHAESVLIRNRRV